MPVTQPNLEALSRTLLYEGYSLFPYLQTAVKNTRPVPFGVVYPLGFCLHHPETSAAMQTDCIVTGATDLQVAVRVRFLQLPGEASTETVEREVTSGDLAVAALTAEGAVLPIEFPNLTGAVSISQRAVDGRPNAFRFTVRITNITPVLNAAVISRNEVFSRCLLSTHTLLTAAAGRFISVLEPDEEWKPFAAQCRNVNTWPVLVGDDDSAMVSSQIILYDHPQLARASQGDLFDSTEIEEALLLHLAVLTDEEKAAIGGADEKLRHMLERAASVTPRELVKLHGACRDTGEPLLSKPEL